MCVCLCMWEPVCVCVLGCEVECCGGGSCTQGLIPLSFDTSPTLVPRYLGWERFTPLVALLL